MQARMKAHQLTTQQIDSLLTDEQVGRLATLDDNGFPYITPVHFAYINGKIYVHGLIKGQKIENIRRNGKVGFEVDRMGKFLLADQSCNVNTEYVSVIISGEASLISDEGKKIEALNAIVRKYVPSLAGQAFPAKMLAATSVIEIAIVTCTGKFYDESCQTP